MLDGSCTTEVSEREEREKTQSRRTNDQVAERRRQSRTVRS